MIPFKYLWFFLNHMDLPVYEPREDSFLIVEAVKELVKGKILEHLRSKKTIVYKMRPKKKTRIKQGHRQDLTRVLIEDIIIN